MGAAVIVSHLVAFGIGIAVGVFACLVGLLYTLFRDWDLGE